ncbi:hypothetical protein HanHA300_Chr16g0609531 [Helianthus annuus]|nr:hypothetical protein HanHA300_Chr16g0609531 [Helianthus annuus]
MFEFLRVKSRGSLLVQAGQMVRLRVRVGFGTWFGVLFDLVFGSACAVHTVQQVHLSGQRLGSTGSQRSTAGSTES